MPIVAGQDILASDVILLKQKTLTAGETINGDTLPVAVFQNTSDNEIYACDGDDIAKLEFIGFAISNGTDTNDIDVQIGGVISGFTGLSEGERYYVQDNKTIGTSIGTFEVLVAIAISETELLIFKDSMQFRGSVSVDTDGTTTSVVPAGTKKIILKAFKAASGDATNGIGVSGGEIVLTKQGITSSLVSMGYKGATGGGANENFRAFRATWATATTVTAKTFSGAHTVETEDTGYSITAYFYI